jgi:glycosyltransferase involved in cell wall biosynthesis
MRIAQRNRSFFDWMMRPFKARHIDRTKAPKPSVVDPKWYLEQYPDVAASGMHPYEHYVSFGKAEGRYPAFDRDWYLAEYPDVFASGLDAREHYEKYGKAELRFPCFDEDWYLQANPDVAAAGIDARTHYMQHGKAEGRKPAYSIYSAQSNYRKWIEEFDTISEKTRSRMREHVERFANSPLISIVMPVYNPKPAWLIEAIESVKHQIYPNWELCIADDCSTDSDIRTILERYAAEDSKIKVVFRTANGHISAASNTAIAIAKGEWIAFLDHDDLLADHALFWVVDAINRSPHIRMIYSDEDKKDEQGMRCQPYFKCDWNPDLLYSHNMFCHLGVYHTDLVARVGGFRLGYEGSQDHDLTLRCSELVGAHQIHHIPRVLYHWRMHAASTAFSSTAKPYAANAGVRAINEHFERRGVKATAESTGYCYRVRYALPKKLPLVSLIIPTRNGLSFLRKCVTSILDKTTYSEFEILIIDNGSDERETLNYLRTLRSDERIRVIHDDRPFNFSALNNAAVKIAKGEIIGLINNDIEVISPEWLSEMVSHATRPEVGAVGARLWYSNDTLQHGGVILGVGVVAGHAHKHLTKNNAGYMGRAICIQSFSAVTAACLIVRKSIYESLGGLNDSHLQIAFNDVEFCIRVREAGFRNIWTPYAELYHHESATRGFDVTPEKIARYEREVEYMKSRWADVIECDPAYSPNLTNILEDFSLSWPPRLGKHDFAYCSNDSVKEDGEFESSKFAPNTRQPRQHA